MPKPSSLLIVLLSPACLCAPLLAQESAPAPSQGLPSFGAADWTSAAKAQEQLGLSSGWDWTRSDSRAPAGVRFSDTLAPEQWMLHLRYTHLEQADLRDNKESYGDAEGFADGYRVLPQEMKSEMVDLELFYGYDPCWTFFAEVPWVAREMDSLTEDQEEFKTEADGIGDVKLGAIRVIEESDGKRWMANLGISLPTGSVDEQDLDEDGQRITLPYAQQLGTGTYDIHPGVTWLQQYDTWTWGIQGQWRLHLGRNDEDWARSDDGEVSAWVMRSFSPDVAGSLRLRGYYWGDVHGEADDLDPDENPLNDRKRQGGERYDVIGGLTWQLDSSGQAIRTLSIEVGKPVVEWLDGPGLSTDFYAIFGWRFSF